MTKCLGPIMIQMPRTRVNRTGDAVWGSVAEMFFNYAGIDF